MAATNVSVTLADFLTPQYIALFINRRGRDYLKRGRFAFS
jgi:hypothetical protein